MRLKEITDNKPKANVDKIRVELATRRGNIQGMEKMNLMQRDRIFGCVEDAGVKLAIQVIRENGLNEILKGFKCISDIKEVRKEQEDLALVIVEHSIQISLEGIDETGETVDFDTELLIKI